MRRACDTERRQQQELRSSEEAPLPVYRKPPNLVPKDKLLPSARFSCRCTSLYKLWLLIRGEVKQVATQPSQREGERYYVKHISASLSLYIHILWLCSAASANLHPSQVERRERCRWLLLRRRTNKIRRRDIERKFVTRRRWQRDYISIVLHPPYLSEYISLYTPQERGYRIPLRPSFRAFRSVYRRLSLSLARSLSQGVLAMPRKHSPLWSEWESAVLGWDGGITSGIGQIRIPRGQTRIARAPARNSYARKSAARREICRCGISAQAGRCVYVYKGNCCQCVVYIVEIYGGGSFWAFSFELCLKLSQKLWDSNKKISLL